MNLQNIMAQAKKMQGDLERITKEIDETIFDGESGLVKIEMNGKKELISIDINKEEKIEDMEILEDMLMVAINEAGKKVDKIKEEKLGKMTGGMGGLF